MSSGWLIDDLLETIENFPHEIRSSLTLMTEKDKQIDALHKSITKSRLRLLQSVKDGKYMVDSEQAGNPGTQLGSHPVSSSSLNVSRMSDKIQKDEQRALSLLDDKISACSDLISTLDSYVPIIQSEMQKSSFIGEGPHNSNNSTPIQASPSPFSHNADTTIHVPKATALLSRRPGTPGVLSNVLESARSSSPVDGVSTPSRKKR